MGETFTKEKGLKNEYGQNSCFINVIIQTLWHLPSFRETFTSLDYTHICKHETCIYCALRVIFTHLQFSDETVVPPNLLQKKLEELGKKRKQFILGELGDAEETFESVLRWFHCDHVGLDVGDQVTEKACQPKCVSHRIFGSEICDIRVCTRCGAMADPLPSVSFIYRIYVSELLADRIYSQNFGDMIKKMYRATLFPCPNPREYPPLIFDTSGHTSDCTSDNSKTHNNNSKESSENNAEKTQIHNQNNYTEKSLCDGHSKIERWCLSIPQIFGFSFVYASDPNQETLKQTLKRINPIINLEDCFKLPALEIREKCTRFSLIGIISFSGRHFLAFFNSLQNSSWMKFDDSKVTRIGDWDKLVKFCLSNSLRPILLFYQPLDISVRPSSMYIAREMEKSSESQELFHISQLAAKHQLAQQHQRGCWTCRMCNREWDTVLVQCPICPEPEIEVSNITNNNTVKTDIEKANETEK